MKTVHVARDTVCAGFEQRQGSYSGSTPNPRFVAQGEKLVCLLTPASVNRY